MNFLSISDLRKKDGLRIVLVAGGPSPWGQAAKAMMEYKGLDYAAGLLIPGDTNDEVVEWAGVNSGPVVVWNDEKPIHTWNDILFLLERLAPSPAVIPEDAEDRVTFFGLAHELNGELGLGWNRRLLMFAPLLDSGSAPEGVARMGEKYKYNQEDAAIASQRIVATMNVLSRRLEAQQAAGSNYFIGNSPSAVDFYWAAFSNLIDLMAADKIPVSEDLRPLFVQNDPAIADAFDDRLRTHRDWFFDAHFRSPMEF